MIDLNRVTKAIVKSMKKQGLTEDQLATLKFVAGIAIGVELNKFVDEHPNMTRAQSVDAAVDRQRKRLAEMVGPEKAKILNLERDS